MCLHIAELLHVSVDSERSPLWIESQIRMKLDNQAVSVPRVRFTPDDETLMSDLLSDEKDKLLDPIKKYLEFLRTLEGKKLIVIPND